MAVLGEHNLKVGLSTVLSFVTTAFMEKKVAIRGHNDVKRLCNKELNFKLEVVM